MTRQLYDFKTGARNGPGAAMMKPQVEKMTADQRIDIVAYLSSLTPVSRNTIMNRTRRGFLMGTAAAGYAALLPIKLNAAEAAVKIATPMAPPEWALLEREALRAHTAACVNILQALFQSRTMAIWKSRNAGAAMTAPTTPSSISTTGRMFTPWAATRCCGRCTRRPMRAMSASSPRAKTTDVPFAKGGMYYKEWPVNMDWQHNGEGLTVFAQMPLGNPYDRRYRERIKRFAGFYMDEDPGAPNYDPKLKLIKSMMNGSKGPMLEEGDRAGLGGRSHRCGAPLPDPGPWRSGLSRDFSTTSRITMMWWATIR